MAIQSTPPPKEDFKMTPEETEKFTESLKNPEFRKLFFDYVKEMEDPETKRVYEEEIRALERERGVNVRYVKPTPHFCVKCHFPPGGKYLIAFINICSSEEVDAPTSKPRPGGGQDWELPYSVAKGREEIDDPDKEKEEDEKKGVVEDKGKGKAPPSTKPLCKVYDVIFHPTTLQKTKTSTPFKDLVVLTALEGLERQFNDKFSKVKETGRGEKGWEICKGKKSKGVPLMTMIREKNEKGKSKSSKKEEGNSPEKKGETSLQFVTRLAQTLSPSSISPPVNPTKGDKKIDNPPITITPIPASTTVTREVIPKFQIVHQTSYNDYQKFTNGGSTTNTSARPDKLLIKLELERLMKVSDATLEITPTTVDFHLPGVYKLHLDLPFPVNDEEGTATFEKRKEFRTGGVMIITLPVLPLPVEKSVNNELAKIEMEEEEKEEIIVSPSAPEVPVIAPVDPVVVKKEEEAEVIEDVIVTPGGREASAMEELSAKFEEKIHLSSSSSPSPLIEEISQNPTPPFHTTQIPGTVAFIVPIGGIVESTVQSSKEGGNTAFKVDFATSEQSYTLHLEFGKEGKYISMEVSTTPINMVILLVKREPALWKEVTLVEGGGRRRNLSFASLANMEDLTSVVEDEPKKLPQEKLKVQALQKPDHVIVDVNTTETLGPKKSSLMKEEKGSFGANLAANLSSSSAVSAQGEIAPSVEPVKADRTSLKFVDSLLYDMEMDDE